MSLPIFKYSNAQVTAICLIKMLSSPGPFTIGIFKLPVLRHQSFGSHPIDLGFLKKNIGCACASPAEETACGEKMPAFSTARPHFMCAGFLLLQLLMSGMWQAEILPQLFWDLWLHAHFAERIGNKGCVTLWPCHLHVKLS
jgi:hypothetical protein